MKKLSIYLACILIICTHSLGAQEVYAKIVISLENEKTLHFLLENGFDTDHTHVENQKITLYVTHDELDILEANGIFYDVLISNFAKHYKEQIWEPNPITRSSTDPNLSCHFSYGSMGGFYTLTEIEDKLDSMNILYPNIASPKYSIGQSIDGRNIYAVLISDNYGEDEEEPVAYFDALHHAREPLAMATTINYMFWLLENYGVDPLVTNLIDNRELYFVPVVNPDGYEYNRQTNPNGGGLWRKNRRNIVNSSCFGVDLNRNYSFGYAANGSCSSTNPCSNTYRGSNFFSEPETVAVRDFMNDIEPSTAFSIHSTAGKYLMPYGYNTSPPAFEIYSEWASDFLDENDYPYGVTYQMLGYTSCGTTRDYMHSEGIYGWTPEIDGSGFWPAPSEIFDLVAENVGPLFYQSWIAGGYANFQSHKQLGDALLGGSFQMEVAIKNKGVGTSAPNVTVELETSNPHITVSGPVSFGNIPVQSKVNNTTDLFNIHVGTYISSDNFDLDIVVYQDGVEIDREPLNIMLGNTVILFSDDGESGSANWTASGNNIDWGQMADDSYSGDFCFGDSDGANSENNSLNYFTMKNNVDLSNVSDPSLEFFAKYSIEEGDFVRLQISTNGGNSWSTLQTFNLNESWKQFKYDLSAYTFSSSVRFRFYMDTDGDTPSDGFYFDDFEIKSFTEQDCVFDLSENGQPIDAGLYNAINSINSNGLINPGDQVTFEAGNFIELLPNFEVSLGANFHAAIKVCN